MAIDKKIMHRMIGQFRKAADEYEQAASFMERIVKGERKPPKKAKKVAKGKTAKKAPKSANGKPATPEKVAA